MRGSTATPDLLAGLTVAAYLIPQCLAYGALAGLEPIHGLWASLPPLLLYALLGSSPQLSVGPESTTALLTAAAVAPLAGGNPAAAASLAALLALLVGLVCGVASLARLGFLADLLSRPILVGYMAGVALIMISNQIEALLGGQEEIHGPSAALGLGVLLFLLVVQRLWPRAPAPLLAVLLSVVVVGLLRLDAKGVAVIGPIPAGCPA